MVGRIKPGTRSRAKVIRSGESKTLTFSLGELPTDERSFIPARAEASSDPLGLRLEDLNDENSQASDPEEEWLLPESRLGLLLLAKLCAETLLLTLLSPVIESP